MNIPLSSFEQVIDETILKRGWSYFKNETITDFTELTADEYEATVLGTEKYTVQIKIKDNTVINHVCTCPYDWGPVCKHVAAVIFYLQNGQLDFKSAQKSRKSKKSKKK